MSNPIRILYVDDYPLDRELVRYTLEKEHGGFAVIEAASRREFEARLVEQEYDLVLSDFNILGFEGLQVLDAVQAACPHVPVIIVTGTGSEEVAVEAMRRGAADYIIKTPEHIRRLPRTIQTVLENHRLKLARQQAEQELEESRQFLQSTLNTLTAHIAILDETGVILAVNAPWRQFARANNLGLPDDGVGCNYLEVCNNATGPDAREAAAAARGIRQVVSGRQARFYLEYACHSPQEQRWFTMRVTSFQYNAAARVVVAHESITARRLAEEEIRQRNREMTGLLEVSQRLSGRLTLPQLLPAFVQAVVDTLPAAEAASLWLYDERLDQLAVRAWAGYPDEAISGLAVSPQFGLLGQVFRTGTAANFGHTKNEPAFEPLGRPGLNAVCAAVGVPLLVEGRPAGVLFADNLSRPNAFNQNDFRWLRSLAGQAAVMIQNARLFEAERDQRLQAESLREVTLALTSKTELRGVLEEILSQVKRIVPYKTANITLLENGLLRTVAWRGYQQYHSESFIAGLVQPLADFAVDRRVVETGQPLVIHDTRQEPDWVTFKETGWIRSHLKMPLYLRDRVIGTLRLDGDKPGEFSLDDADRLRPLANAAAIALENARLLETERAAQARLRNLAGYLQAAREEERGRIAREIHDEFGQALTALKMDLAWLGHRLPPDDPRQDKITAMSGLVDSTIQLVRRIATELRPGLLDDLGLTAAIEWQAQEIAERTGLDISLNLGSREPALNRDLTTAVFRIFQETLTNIVRHAGATSVQVTLADDPRALTLTVQDNGRGITREQTTSPASLGLMGMRERARAFAGQVTIRGRPGQGTTVTVSIPKTAQEEPVDD